MSVLAKQVFDALKANNEVLVTAESCTGGMIASAITDFAGSSTIFDRGFVTYSNQAKIDCLGVKEMTLQKFGAVSEETAEEMAKGALKNSLGTIAISVTGIAGPSGGSEEKPVGLVYIGIAQKKGTCTVYKNDFEGNRSQIRQQTVEKAFSFILEYLR